MVALTAGTVGCDEGAVDVEEPGSAPVRHRRPDHVVAVPVMLSPAWQHAAMVLRHPDGDYAITAMYSVPDDAWYLELDLVAGQRALVTAIVPDEDPAREPTVCFNPHAGHVDVPYEVMCWFMHQVDEEIRTSRAWMRLRPELVEIIHQLRQEHMGVIDDDDFPQVLADVRTTVPEEDLPAVLEAAFGRNPDGTTMDHSQTPQPVDGQGDRGSRR